MPQNNISGTNQLSGHTPTQAFLQNLFLGENLRQRQKEIEASNNISQQEQILNEQDIERQQQIMAKAADEALKNSFNQEQDFRNTIALGTTPSEFSGSQGTIFDVAKMLPGQPAPTQNIEFGQRTAKNYKGEDVSVDTNEQGQRQKAVGKQLQLTEQDSIAKQAG